MLSEHNVQAGAPLTLICPNLLRLTYCISYEQEPWRRLIMITVTALNK